MSRQPGAINAIQPPPAHPCLLHPITSDAGSLVATILIIGIASVLLTLGSLLQG